MDATIGYDLNVFADNGIEALENANFSVLSTITVPEEFLSVAALDAVNEE
jgi:hypothetical protein